MRAQRFTVLEGKEAPPNCFDCVDSLKAEIPGKVLCTFYGVVVSCGLARICPHYAPLRRRKGLRR